jgi:hypothetical protein
MQAADQIGADMGRLPTAGRSFVIQSTLHDANKYLVFFCVPRKVPKYFFEKSGNDPVIISCRTFIFVPIC